VTKAVWVYPETEAETPGFETEAEAEEVAFETEAKTEAVDPKPRPRQQGNYVNKSRMWAVSLTH